MSQDLYAILGVTYTATDTEIKKVNIYLITNSFSDKLTNLLFFIYSLTENW